MRRIPILPTLLVLAAAAAMIALGIWQLQRRVQKEALIAVLRVNPSRPAIAFPPFAPVDSASLFRLTSIHCLRVAGWQQEAGKAADGTIGLRIIAQCVTGAEGPGALVNVGIAQFANVNPRWAGGQVDGWLSEEPDHRSLLVRLSGAAPPLRPMLIARTPAPGLKAAAPPQADDIPNNHLAYAVQWFLFAAVALVIYFIALRQRLRAPPRQP